MTGWELKHVNSFEGPSLAIQTTYENRYFRASMRKILSRLPNRCIGADFGAGYGRLTPMLEEFFDKAVGFEREEQFIRFGDELAKTHEITKIDTLSSVPLSDGEAAFAFICTVLHHMTDPEVIETVGEMKRVAKGGFVMLIESTEENFLLGEEVRGGLFTKGRAISEYERFMSPWVLDFARPRHMGGTNQVPPWGSIMVFRDPSIPATPGPVISDWFRSELTY
ncbi:class I SAM-dependent methyltransferase [Methylobacterium isbiliense]|uniref:class I SAM-dependent methyltransferase n=1 Tax=Methylobacterium isbiliense TaxID=315478 RepID=UPI001EE387B6|nr:methyltransferase domain-containing protein [Methylobacterium isbiliense]MDN3625781.1 methyltransferase domain-containing protein [Methylobacterium isbiliense]